MGNLTDAQIELLDDLLAGYDLINMPPAGKSRKLLGASMRFRPSPVTRADINIYIDNSNRWRSETLPNV